MRKIFLLFMLSIALFAKSDKLSSISLPEAVFINLDTFSCNSACLKSYIDKRLYFSFLAHYDFTKQDKTIKDTYDKLNALFSISADLPNINITSKIVRIALLVPQKRIRRYAITSVNSVISYLFARDINFDIEVFNSYDESENSLLREIENIKRANFQFVIAPLTPQGANFVARNAEGLVVFVPTLHHSLMQVSPNNIIYGGISYQEQIQKLANFANQRVALFSDGSSLSKRLNSIVEGEFMQIAYRKELNTKALNLKPILKGNRILQNSSVFLNMPLVKSSLLASQLRAYEIRPHALLSTQINYNPMLINLTQYHDRKKLYIANSIQDSPFKLSAINSIFGHSIVYDWVNYATSVGTDFLVTHYFLQGVTPVFNEEIRSNQVLYDTQIMKSSPFGFYSITR